MEVELAKNYHLNILEDISYLTIFMVMNLWYNIYY